MGCAAPRSASALLLLLLLFLLRAKQPLGAELTFELPDNAKQCFHEEVEQGVKFSLDYQSAPQVRAGDGMPGRIPQPGKLARETSAGPETLTNASSDRLDTGPGLSHRLMPSSTEKWQREEGLQK
ncbi:hypothetical protein P7K49_013049 [Saguinus oedipus]|uniref:GOLD domain-containing protein n=1 Tax=Saguinus oedipus TaxID=9490 RepID=A0ABQ9VET8_SAGOE|nr:hypothetical protein P7K49_013049 [Saguinus oedipus]